MVIFVLLTDLFFSFSLRWGLSELPLRSLLVVVPVQGPPRAPRRPRGQRPLQAARLHRKRSTRLSRTRTTQSHGHGTQNGTARGMGQS